MNKEEILQKAQSKRSNTPDEMELQVMQKGNGIAVFFILVFCLILMVVKMIAKQPWYDVYCIVFAGGGAQRFYKGIKLHRRYEITIGIAYTVIAIFGAVGYIYDILG